MTLQLILDLMGGDKAPHAILEGAIQALPELSQTRSGATCELVLLGDEAVIQPLLKKRRYRVLGEALAQGEKRAGCSVRFIHAPETIEMDDSIRAVRSKKNASINIGCQLAGDQYQAKKSSAFISAGHSGAMMASALLKMGRLKGVERPAIAVKLPSLSEDGCVVIDVGANVDCKPEHLRDFAIMGALFAQVGRKRSDLPRVAILSNGEEKSKGTELTREAYKMVEALPCFYGEAAVGQFKGYAEGKEIFKGQVDVVVTDGFVGNIVLKTAESLASAIVTMLKSEAKRSPVGLVGFVLAAGVFRRLKKRIDYAETGAAPLLGVAGYAFICHGRSNQLAIKNALFRAKNSLEDGFVQRLEAAVAGAKSREPEKGSS